MWKPNQSEEQNPQFSHDPIRPAPIAPPADFSARASTATVEMATIGKDLVVRGEITGTESLFVNGRVEGSITLPGNRVTVGATGQVSASMAVCITAREIVVLGRVQGNLSATERVEIRAEGTVIGDVSTIRISIEDGAYFKGSIDIRKPENKQGAREQTAPVSSRVVITSPALFGDPKPTQA